MNRQNRLVTNRRGRIEDPQRKLPSELVSHFLSLLPPSAIARSSAVSKQWRAFILSSPALHREIDLLRIGDAFALNFIIYHVSQVSLLSLHSLVKVSLNVTGFIKESPVNWKFNEFHNTSKIGWEVSSLDVLLSILQHSSNSLKEIRLRSGVGGDYRKTYYDNPFSFFLPIINKLQSFPSLQLLHIETPTDFNLEAGNQANGSKQFKLTENWPVEERWVGVPRIADLVREVKRFVDGGISFFGSASRIELLPENESIRVLRELGSSRATIRHLEVPNSFLPVEFWNLAMRCNNLRTLILEAYGPHNSISFPDDENGCTALRNLILKLRNHVVRWDSFPIWFGRSLQELVLDLDDWRRPGYVAPKFPQSLLINCRQSLRILHIKNASIDFNGTPLQSFPLLRSFYLCDVTASVLLFFLDFEAPKLQNLKIEGGLFGEGLALSQKLVSKYSSQLVHLSLHLDNPTDLTFRDSSTFRFFDLEKLSLTNFSIGRWLSRSTFPELLCFYGREEIETMFLTHTVRSTYQTHDYEHFW